MPDNIFYTYCLELYPTPVRATGFGINATIYELLILKSESSTISVSGLSTQDTSGYFKRLASKYKPFNSHIMSGG